MFVNPPGSIEILLNEDDIHALELHMTQMLKLRGFPTDWGQIGIVYEDQHGCLLRDAVRFPGGKLGTYIRFIARENVGSGVVVLPLYEDYVLLIRRFHHATRTWHLEIPFRPGMSGLSAEENARRMLMEETGATLSNLSSLGETDTGPGMAGEGARFFCANISSYGQVKANESSTEPLRVTVSEFEQLIQENEITEGFTLVAFAHARLQGLL